MTDIAIIGAGHAGGKLYQYLINNNHKGKIFIFGDEKYFPYERPPLSKGFLSGEKKIEDFTLKIDTKDKSQNKNIFLNNKIKKIDIENKKIIDANDIKYSFDKIVFATGGSPKKIDINSLKNIFYLRNIDDCLEIKSHLLSNDNIVIIGAGYIGLEIASTIRKLFKNKSITIIESSSNILGRNCNDDLRDIILKFHKENKIKFYFNSEVKNFLGQEKIQGINLSNNKKINCDLLIVGIGIKPNTELISNTSIADDKGIIVNEYSESKIKNVYAIGDIAFFKSNFFNKHVREESWNNAEKQSFFLTQNIIGKKLPYDEIPWFWTDQFEKNIQILGNINDFDSSIERNYDDQRITKFFLRNNKITGVFSIDYGKDITISRKIMKKNLDLDIDKLKDININLKSFI